LIDDDQERGYVHEWGSNGDDDAAATAAAEGQSSLSGLDLVLCGILAPFSPQPR
jgi:hypothetical protein